MQHCTATIPHGYEGFSQFRQYKYKDSIVTCLPGDCCVHIDDLTCAIRNILFSKSGKVKVACLKFSKTESFSSYLFDLKLINICKVSVSDLSRELYVEKLSNIEFRCVLLPHSVEHDYFVSMPLLPLLHNV